MRALSEANILDLINSDPWMMGTLKEVQDLALTDCWIGAGFIRNKVWDYQSNYTSPTPLGDIDVVYFDPNNINEQIEKQLEQKLIEVSPNKPWSVKNQARMHLPSNESPYQSTEHAISLWPETATSIAVRLSELNKLEMMHPHGISDLTNLVVRPTPHWMLKLDKYRERLMKKNWQKKWPQLVVVYAEESESID